MPEFTKTAHSVSVEDGSGLAHRARITSDGSVQAQPAESGTGTQNFILNPASQVIADANVNRRQVQIQNLGDTGDAYVALGMAASTSSIKLPPGATYSFPPGVSFQGDIQGMSPLSAHIVVVQFKY